MLTSYDFDGFKGKFIYKWSFLAGKIIEFDPGLPELNFTNRTGYIERVIPGKVTTISHQETVGCDIHVTRWKW